jgi:hypothetical protein
VSICRESSARALVCEIVRDWFNDAIFAVPTPTRESSGTLLIASLIDFGIPLFALRPVWFAEAEVLPLEDTALPVEVSAFFDEAQAAAIKTARRQTQT